MTHDFVRYFQISLVLYLKFQGNTRLIQVKDGKSEVEGQGNSLKHSTWNKLIFELGG